MNLVQGWLMTGLTQRVCYRMRREIIAKIDRMPLSYFETNSVGDVMSRGHQRRRHPRSVAQPERDAAHHLHHADHRRRCHDALRLAHHGGDDLPHRAGFARARGCGGALVAALLPPPAVRSSAWWTVSSRRASRARASSRCSTARSAPSPTLTCRTATSTNPVGARSSSRA